MLLQENHPFEDLSARVRHGAGVEWDGLLASRWVGHGMGGRGRREIATEGSRVPVRHGFRQRHPRGSCGPRGVSARSTALWKTKMAMKEAEKAMAARIDPYSVLERGATATRQLA